MSTENATVANTIPALRNEPRKRSRTRKTTIAAAPARSRRSVSWRRTSRLPSYSSVSRMPGGSAARSSSTFRFTASATRSAFVPTPRIRKSVTAGLPSIRK